MVNPIKTDASNQKKITMEILKTIGLVVLTIFALILLIKDLSAMTPSERKDYFRWPRF